MYLKPGRKSTMKLLGLRIHVGMDEMYEKFKNLLMLL